MSAMESKHSFWLEDLQKYDPPVWPETGALNPDIIADVEVSEWLDKLASAGAFNLYGPNCLGDSETYQKVHERFRCRGDDDYCKLSICGPILARIKCGLKDPVIAQRDRLLGSRKEVSQKTIELVSIHNGAWQLRMLEEKLKKKRVRTEEHDQGIRGEGTKRIESVLAKMEQEARGRTLQKKMAEEKLDELRKVQEERGSELSLLVKTRAQDSSRRVSRGLFDDLPPSDGWKKRVSPRIISLKTNKMEALKEKRIRDRRRDTVPAICGPIVAARATDNTRPGLGRRRRTTLCCRGDIMMAIPLF